ncbi:MAG: hypothetical protein A7316_06625 [Candidatus Altiarchaeales archaeon WOR_SM1_86-2]|nr:MAG: hypothetical protein A7316_06625 [Candidatus Altiarchaeales archaeon WOR_SM1_86-2]
MASAFESQKLAKVSEPFEGIAHRLSAVFPNLGWNLKQGGYGVSPAAYIARVLYMTASLFIGIVGAIMLPALLLDKMSEGIVLITTILPVVTVLLFLYFVFMPGMMAKKRARKIDKDLGFALKDLQIQVSAGIPLFDGIVNISAGGYGECSREIRGIVHDVESGKSLIRSLEGCGLATTSEYLRRVMWQLVNALHAGSDVSLALQAISKDLEIERRTRIKAYAQELNMWGLIYMLAAVVLPSMGVTLMVILSSFLGGEVIGETLFWMVLAFLVFFQVFFIQFVKSKRPDV